MPRSFRPQPPTWFYTRLGAPRSGPGSLEAGEVSFHPVAGGALRVVHLPGRGAGRPVVLVPGWGAVMEGWRDFYDPLVGRVELYVIETLEKSTTRIDRAFPDRSVRRMARDVDQTLRSLKLGDHALLGSSWGATVMLQGLIEGLFEDTPALVACDPIPRMWFSPWFLKTLGRCLPSRLVGWLRDPIKWIALRNFIQPVQRRRIELFIERADPWRWKHFAIAAAGLDLYGELEAIEREVWVTSCSQDVIHDRQMYLRVVEELPAGRFFFYPAGEARRERFNAAVAEALAAARGGELPGLLDRLEQPVGAAGR